MCGPGASSSAAGVVGAMNPAAAVSTGWARISAWRSARKPGPLPVRPAYALPNRLQRNRRKLAVALFFFTLIYVFAFQTFGRFIVVQFLLPLVIPVALIIWALPETGRPPVKILASLFFVFLVSSVLWPNYLAIDVPGLPWISIIRITGGPLLLILLICLSVSAEFRKALAETFMASSLSFRFLLAFFVLLSLSVFFSSQPFWSLNRLFVAIITNMSIVAVASYVFQQPRQATRFIYGLAVCAIILCIIAFFEARVGRILWANHIPSFFAIEDESVQRILAGNMRAATGIYRVQAKFSTPLAFAEFLAIATPFLLHLAVTARQWLVRIIAWICLPAVFYIILLTDSRLGAGGFMLAVMIYIFIWSAKRWRTNRQSIFGAAITLAYPALFSLFLLATIFVGRINNLVWGTGAHQASTDARSTQWTQGIDKILDRPWGYGLGKAADIAGTMDGNDVLSIDSYYLTVLVDTGVLGFMAWLVAILAICFIAGRYAVTAEDGEEGLLAPACIAMVVFFVIKSVLSEMENHPLIFAIIGLVFALVYRQKRRLAALPQPAHPFSRPVL
jgi:O-antigen ligase